MSLSYRDIKADEHYAEEVWKIEECGPGWFRDAGNLWTPTFDKFLDFWRLNDQIWGLFDNGSLCAIVYLEYQGPVALNIHVSVLRKVDESALARWFESLVRLKAADGFEVMTGFVVKQNRGLLRVAGKAGFRPTGLTMRYGQHRGRVIEWIQVRA